MTAEEALKIIEDVAGSGYRTAILDHPKNLSDQAAMELMKLGYKVHKHTEPMTGIEKYLASW